MSILKNDGMFDICHVLHNTNGSNMNAKQILQAGRHLNPNFLIGAVEAPEAGITRRCSDLVKAGLIYLAVSKPKSWFI